MATRTLKDKLLFLTATGESVLPPECAVIVITSTVATPPIFLLQHFLHELLSETDGSVVFLSFLGGIAKYASGVKRLVTFRSCTAADWEGTDLTQVRQQDRFVFIDGFSHLFNPISQPPQKEDRGIGLSLTSQPSWIDQLAHLLVQTIGKMKSRPSLVIEGLDFLLAAAPEHIPISQVLGLLSAVSDVLTLLWHR
jgi:hypothetical protein